VRTGDLAATLRPLLTLWRDERADGETFGDFCHQHGVEALREKVEGGRAS